MKISAITRPLSEQYAEQFSDIVREYCPARRTARIRTNSLGCSVALIFAFNQIAQAECGPIDPFYIQVVENSGPTLKGIYGLEFQQADCPLGYTVIDNLWS